MPHGGRKWEKSPQELIDLFYASLPNHPELERRKMFEYPCAFVHRHMFAGVHENNLFLRLPSDKQQELQKDFSAEHFAPNGRQMREYMLAPQDLRNQPELLAQWVFVAFEYARSLPPKK